MPVGGDGLPLYDTQHRVRVPSVLKPTAPCPSATPTLIKAMMHAPVGSDGVPVNDAQHRAGVLGRQRCL